MSATGMHSAAIAAFACTGDACPDTCCKGWGMQLTAETIAKYQAEAPELLEAVTSGEAEHIMKRDANTDYCVKFDAGWCGIHKKYGDSFLGDACHFFPRVTRQLGEMSIMTGSLSCPEMVRLGVLEGKGFALEGTDFSRLPFSLKDYLPEGLPAEKALAAHQAFLSFAVESAEPVGTRIAMIRSVAASLEMVDATSWGMAVPFYLGQAKARLPIAESRAEDPFNLLNALQGLVGAAKQTPRPRLMQTISTMEKALHVTLNWDTLGIALQEDSLAAYQAMEGRWVREWLPALSPVLGHWLQAQLSVALFPFAGFGNTLSERATIIGVRYATLCLALMSACEAQGGVPAAEEQGRIMQSLARFLDHLADPALSMQIYSETGWVREARLYGLFAG